MQPQFHSGTATAPSHLHGKCIFTLLSDQMLAGVTNENQPKKKANDMRVPRICSKCKQLRGGLKTFLQQLSHGVLSHQRHEQQQLLHIDGCLGTDGS